MLIVGVISAASLSRTICPGEISFVPSMLPSSLSLSPSFVLPVGVLTTVVVAVGRPLEELLLTLIHLIRSLSPFIRILFLSSGSLSVGNGAYKINRCYPDCSPVETRQAQEGTDLSSLSLFLSSSAFSWLHQDRLRLRLKATMSDTESSGEIRSSLTTRLSKSD